ncbi:hypothetical protein D3C74_345380 [compost metagenome]
MLVGEIVTVLLLADTVMGTDALLEDLLSVTPPLAMLVFKFTLRLKVITGLVLTPAPVLPLVGLNEVAVRAVAEVFAVVKDQLSSEDASPFVAPTINAPSGKLTL